MFAVEFVLTPALAFALIMVLAKIAERFVNVPDRLVPRRNLDYFTTPTRRVQRAQVEAKIAALEAQRQWFISEAARKNAEADRIYEQIARESHEH